MCSHSSLVRCYVGYRNRWFGDVDKEESERLLTPATEGTFLVRLSGNATSAAATEESLYCASYRAKTDIRHLRFTRTWAGGLPAYAFVGSDSNSKPCASMLALIDAHKKVLTG